MDTRGGVSVAPKVLLVHAELPRHGAFSFLKEHLALRFCPATGEQLAEEIRGQNPWWVVVGQGGRRVWREFEELVPGFETRSTIVFLGEELPPDLRTKTVPHSGHTLFVGSSPAIRQIRRSTTELAAWNTTVLITGETGVGKELAARIIHELSPRAQRPLISVNCAAIPDSLLESEFFGYQKGSFTGAGADFPGKLRMADGGTLFLDEVGELSLQGQAKLLRVLETKEVVSIGAKQPVRVDFRLIAATNRDLDAATREGLFRKDLLYRLKVAEIEIPSLREHANDVPEICQHYIEQLRASSPSRVRDFEPDALELLCSYDWPGNVRELRNVIESACIRTTTETIGIDQLPAALRRQSTKSLLDERSQLLEALETHSWNKSKAAKSLRWSRMTLYRKLVQYQIAVTLSHPSARRDAL